MIIYFNPVSEQQALTELIRLPERLTARTKHSYLYRGSEGKSLQGQAKCNLRWHQLFVGMNRRSCR